APEEDELARTLHERRRGDAHRHDREGQQHDLAETVSVNETGGERADESVKKKIHGNREGNRRPRPTELLLQRHDKNARRRAHSGAHEQSQKGNGGHDPRVVHFDQRSIHRWKTGGLATVVTLFQRLRAAMGKSPPDRPSLRIYVPRSLLSAPCRRWS